MIFYTFSRQQNNNENDSILLGKNNINVLNNCLLPTYIFYGTTSSDLGGIYILHYFDLQINAATFDLL